MTEPCAICGELGATHSMQTQQFAFREGDKEVLLTATVPVLTCAACGESFTGAEAEEIQHAAVCRYLGRLTPAEIRALRLAHGLTQARLAEKTGIGIASIKRWENGTVIQNASLDARLRSLGTPSVGSEEMRPTPRFQTELGPELFVAARQFKLRQTFAQAA
nr:type II TA system antitoxin MqsA family protein [uncultured Sphingomonas sp.]